MKKKLISAAILLGASTLAFGQQVENAKAPMALNPDGLGQVLLYPYYNVNEGFDTAFTVVNTSDTYRAVKVRIVEGKNSWEVLDFNVYMSPNDTWQGMVHRDGDEIKILTSDTTCTAPKLDDPNKPAVLRPYNLTDIEGKQIRPVSLFTDKRYKKAAEEIEAEYADPANILKRMSEGYIEVIDMGRIYDNTIEVSDTNVKLIASILGMDDAANATVDGVKAKLAALFDDSEKAPGLFDSLLKGIRHDNETGKPGNCNVLLRMANGYWLKKSPDIGIYSDGESVLSGSATLINVGKGHAGSYNAVAIKHFVGNEFDAKVYGDEIIPDPSQPDKKEYISKARAYKDGDKDLAYTLHNPPGASYPNLNGQVQRGKIFVYPQTLATHALITYNGGGMKASVPVNKALYDNTNKYTDLDAVADTDFPGALSLTAILMTQDVIGEYVVDPNLKAASDWVVTMPTKHYFTNPDTTDLGKDYTSTGQFGFIAKEDASGNSNVLDPQDDVPSLKHTVDAYKPFSKTAFSRDALVELAGITIFNREEDSWKVSYEFDFSPSLGVADTGMNAEANVLHFSQDKTKKIFNSMNEHMLNEKENYREGWAKISFNDQFLSNKEIEDVNVNCSVYDADTNTSGALSEGNDFCLRGLPVIGIAATKYVNSILYIEGIGDVLSNYMGVVDLTYKRDNEVKTQ